MNAPAIALIGCGAIAEQFHLPALARNSSVAARLVLVDPDEDRARALGAKFGLSTTARDYRDLLEDLQGVVVAAPHRFHHPISLDCIRAGVHVLSEKPLSEKPDEARELVDEAKRASVALAVNQTRRLFSSFRAIRDAIAEGRIGRPRRLDFLLGEPFDWPAATSGYFGLGGSGKGVLLDTGAHVVDLVCWWLSGRPAVVDYRDDSLGGTEAVADLSLRHEDCEAHIRLSWLSKLANRFRIEGDAGAIEGGVYEWSSYQIEDASGRSHKVRTDSRSRDFSDFANMLIDNFVAVAQGQAEPLVPGREVVPSIEVIDECYARRARFEMPWLEHCGARRDG